MEKLHAAFVEGCLRQPGMTDEMAEELFRQVAAFASFGFAKSHAAAFARTAYESAFLKLFYPAQFLVGLVNAQPMGFYPVEVLVNDAKRHGVSVLPVDLNASTYKTTTEWVGRPGEPLPDGAGIDARPEPVRSPACVVPSAEAQERWTPEVTTGLGCPARPAPGQGHRRAAPGAARGRARARAVPVAGRTWSNGPGCPEEVLERLIRTGAMDSLGRPRPGAAVAAPRGGRGLTRPDGRPGTCARSARRRASDQRPRPDGRWTCTCPDRTLRHSPRSPSRNGSAMPTR
jgi:error-prone DNA polymerase